MTIEKLDLAYLMSDATKKYAYLPMPYMLIDHPAYADIEAGAKILYTLLLNRLALSDRNRKNFSDANGRIYIIYTVEQVETDMKVSHATAVKYLKNLQEKGLIKRVRQGQGKPAITYVMDFASILDADEHGANNEKEQKYKNYTSRGIESKLQEVQKVNDSKKDNSKTNNSQSIKEKNKHSLTVGKRNNIYITDSQMEALRCDYGDKTDGLIDEVSDRIYARGDDASKIQNYYRYIQTVARTLGMMTVADAEKIKQQEEDHQHRIRYECAKRMAYEGLTPDEKERRILTEAEIQELEDIAKKAKEEFLKEKRQKNQEYKTAEDISEYIRTKFGSEK